MRRFPVVRMLAWPLVAVLLPACGISGGGTLTPTVAPGIPSDVAARPGNASVTLDWVESAQGSQYTILRSQLPQGPFFPISVPAQFTASNRYLDPNLTNGTTYYYQVVAANGFGQGVPSSTVSGTPGFKAVALGASCTSTDAQAILRDGSVWEWGETCTGQEVDMPMRLPIPKDVTAYAPAADHELALASDGTVWGVGSVAANTVELGAVPVANLTGVIAIAAGYQFSLALTFDGKVWVWGSNGQGQFGTGSTDPAMTVTPQLVPGLSNIVAISAGYSHAMALRDDGLVFVWGDNTQGQLATGATSLTPGAVAQVSGVTGITAISAGSNFCLTLRSDGSIWGWGDNSRGQLGVGTPDAIGNNKPPTVFVPTWTPGSNGVIGIAAGAFHSAALVNDGTVWTWGLNYYGALGYGTSGGYIPVTVPGQVPGLTGIVQVAVTTSNTLARGADGTVYIWGDNSLGQLGNGTGTEVSTPLELPNITAATAVAAGNSFSLFARNSGLAYGVGETDLGQLGDGGGVYLATSDPFFISGPTGVTALAAGSGFEANRYVGGHGLALTTTGDVWGWGRNDQGQVGNGSTLFADISTLQGSPPVKALTPTGIIAISAGQYHSLAIRKDPGTGVQTAWAWGENSFGRCGQGLPYNSDLNHPDPALLIPSPVVNLTGVVSISAGSYHSLAALSDGSVWAWGVNGSGQLGQPDTVVGNNASVLYTTGPLQVPGITTAVAVAAGTDFSLALLSDGTVLAWGYGFVGELGHGGQPGTVDIPSGPTPVQVLNLTGVTAIAAGDRHALALKSDGTVWSWGYNVFGQLGNPVNLASSVPVQVQGISNAVQISAGYAHSMALLGNGTIRLWGQNQLYELGIPYVFTSTTPVIVTR